MWLWFFSLDARRPEWGGWELKESEHVVCAEKSLKECFSRGQMWSSYFSKRWPLFHVRRFSFWVSFKTISKRLNNLIVSEKENCCMIHCTTDQLSFTPLHLESPHVVVQMIRILFEVCCYNSVIQVEQTELIWSLFSPLLCLSDCFANIHSHRTNTELLGILTVSTLDPLVEFISSPTDSS